MNSQLVLASILGSSGLGLFAGYVFFLYKRYGVLKSISEGHYRLKLEGKDHFFRWVCTGVVFTLLPALFILAPDTRAVVFSFLACLGLLFVGAASNFKEKLDGKVHYLSAVLCYLCSQLLTVFVVKIPFVSLFCLLTAVLIASKDKNWLWWIEISAIASLFIGFVKLTLMF